MLVPIEWLNDYIDTKDIDTTEFCDRMIMSGSNLETCEHFCEEMSNVVVGKIEKIERRKDKVEEDIIGDDIWEDSYEL